MGVRAISWTVYNKPRDWGGGGVGVGGVGGGGFPYFLPAPAGAGRVAGGAFAFAGFAPKTLHHRFLTEDTPYSMVPMAALGRLAGVPTPIMDALIALLGELLGEDYAVTGQTAERMGLAGMTPEAIRNLVSA